jgi:glutaconate CoA-transferase, subunit A
MSKVVPLADAVASVPHGARVGVGGILLQRKPMAFLAALADHGTRELQLYSFLASLDAELLAAHGALAAAHTGYVGFEQLGFAPAYEAGVAAGAITAHEYTEFLFVAGLRASLAGLPFQPAKGGLGSDILEELGYEYVTCPYTGQVLVAVPAISPDVTVIHAEAADENGTVMGPAGRDFLFDFDANIARAATRVIVTVDRVVPTEEIVAANHRTLLFGFEVDAVVEVPHGAYPTALPGLYEPDLAGLRRYLSAVQSGGDHTQAMRDFLAGGSAR